MMKKVLAVHWPWNELVYISTERKVLRGSQRKIQTFQVQYI